MLGLENTVIEPENVSTEGLLDTEQIPTPSENEIDFLRQSLETSSALV